MFIKNFFGETLWLSRKSIIGFASLSAVVKLFGIKKTIFFWEPLWLSGKVVHGRVRENQKNLGSLPSPGQFLFGLFGLFLCTMYLNFILNHSLGCRKSQVDCQKEK
jgi:hypothetical protein